MSQIVYLFVSTNWQNVNLLPALELKPAHTILVAVCARGHRFEQDDIVHALNPVHNFGRAYEAETASLQQNHKPRYLVSRGPVESIDFWRKQIFKDLVDLGNGAPKDATVVFSYLAGPTDPKIGIWLGLEDLSAARPDLCFRKVAYSAEGKLLWREQDGSESVQELHRPLSLDAWFSLRGRFELEANKSTRILAQNEALQFRKVAESIAEANFKSPGLPENWFLGSRLIDL